MPVSGIAAKFGLSPDRVVDMWKRGELRGNASADPDRPSKRGRIGLVIEVASVREWLAAGEVTATRMRARDGVKEPRAARPRAGKRRKLPDGFVPIWPVPK